MCFINLWRQRHHSIRRNPPATRDKKYGRHCSKGKTHSCIRQRGFLMDLAAFSRCMTSKLDYTCIKKMVDDELASEYLSTRMQAWYIRLFLLFQLWLRAYNLPILKTGYMWMMETEGIGDLPCLQIGSIQIRQKLIWSFSWKLPVSPQERNWNDELSNAFGLQLHPTKLNDI